MTDQPSVEEARESLNSAVRDYADTLVEWGFGDRTDLAFVDVARHRDNLIAAVRRDTLREVREAVGTVRTHSDDGYFSALAKIDDIEAALDRLEARE